MFPTASSERIRNSLKRAGMAASRTVPNSRLPVGPRGRVRV